MYKSTMQVQKQGCIILLLLLCQHACLLSANVRKTVACEGGSAFLTCDLGYINVVNANYGRTDTTTCSAGKPYDHRSNAHCFQETSLRTMSTRCNGKKSCHVHGVNSVFSDPCVGTYKYLSVTYECLQQIQSITCEHSESVIDCGNKGVISVHHANYGRRSHTTCPNIHGFADCFYPETASLRSRCNGRGSCHLSASNSVFGDPCYGTYKYLEVTYSCVSEA